MFHFSDALQALWNLMEATLTAVQFQSRDFPRLVEQFPTYGSTGVVGDVAAAVLCLLSPFQAREELGLVARSTGFVQVSPRSGQSARGPTQWIQGEMTATPSCPVPVSLHFCKNEASD